jgi:hypothetical protein
VPAVQHLEGHLLALGSSIDGVAGRGIWRLERETVRAVVQRHPRLRYKSEVERLLRAEAEAVPPGRIGCLYRYGSLGPLIARAPFEE